MSDLLVVLIASAAFVGLFGLVAICDHLGR
jgi:hypothetical protein